MAGQETNLHEGLAAQLLASEIRKQQPDLLCIVRRTGGVKRLQLGLERLHELLLVRLGHLTWGGDVQYVADPHRRSLYPRLITWTPHIHKLGQTRVRDTCGQRGEPEARTPMASLPGPAEPEPDMEFDLTLASCCQREIRDRRIKQGRLDIVRAGMPAAVFPAPPPACPRVFGLVASGAAAQRCPVGERTHARPATRVCAPAQAEARAVGRAARGRWAARAMNGAAMPEVVCKPLCESPNTIPSPWRPVLRSWWTSRSSWLSTQVD